MEKTMRSLFMKGAAQAQGQEPVTDLVDGELDHVAGGALVAFNPNSGKLANPNASTGGAIDLFTPNLKNDPAGQNKGDSGANA